jgi:hypothetical protein
MTPSDPLASVPPPIPETTVAPGPPRRGWQSRLLTACLAIFTFEIGLFLVVFPWMDSWNLNYFSGIIPSSQDWWDQPAFRGAISGLGLVNVYIAMRQTIRIFQRD